MMKTFRDKIQIIIKQPEYSTHDLKGRTFITTEQRPVESTGKQPVNSTMEIHSSVSPRGQQQTRDTQPYVSTYNITNNKNISNMTKKTSNHVDTLRATYLQTILISMIIGVISLGAVITAQAQDVIYKSNFGGSGNDYYYAATTVSDGVVAVGYSQAASFDNGNWLGFTGRGGVDGIIVKYNNSGDIVWKKNFGGSNGDWYLSTTLVSDGLVAVGMSEEASFGNGDWTGISGKGNYDDYVSDATIVKYDNYGNIVWKKNFGGSSYDTYNSATTVSDGIIAVGQSHVSSFNNGDWEGITGKGDYDAIIVKFDNDGNVVWKKNFGGNDEDTYNSVTAVTDGVVAVGYSEPASFGNGDWTGISGTGGGDAIIVKYDNDGNLVWKKNYGKSDEYYIYKCIYNSVTTVHDGIIAVGGDNIVKYDNNGNIIWEKEFNAAHQCITAISNGFIVAGYALENAFGVGDWANITGRGNCDAIIVKYDDNGNVVWKKNFGGSSMDYYRTITASADSIVAVGYSYPDSFGNGDWEEFTGKGGNDAIIVKYTLSEGYSITELEENKVTIYPNPATDNIAITGLSKGDRIYVSNINGSKVIQTIATNEVEIIEISHLSAGVYFVKAGASVVKLVVN